MVKLFKMKLIIAILLLFPLAGFCQNGTIIYKVANRSFDMYNEVKDFNLRVTKISEGKAVYAINYAKDSLGPRINTFEQNVLKTTTRENIPDLFSEVDAVLGQLVRLERRWGKYFTSNQLVKMQKGDVVSIRYKILFFNHFVKTDAAFLSKVKDADDKAAFLLINNLVDKLEKYR